MTYHWSEGTSAQAKKTSKEELVSLMREIEHKLELVSTRFDLETDEDLLDSCIYEQR